MCEAVIGSSLMMSSLPVNKPDQVSFDIVPLMQTTSELDLWVLDIKKKISFALIGRHHSLLAK